MSRRDKVVIAFVVAFDTAAVKLLGDQYLRTLPMRLLVVIAFGAGCALAALIVYTRRRARRPAVSS